MTCSTPAHTLVMFIMYILQFIDTPEASAIGHFSVLAAISILLLLLPSTLSLVFPIKTVNGEVNVCLPVVSSAVAGSYSLPAEIQGFLVVESIPWVCHLPQFYYHVTWHWHISCIFGQVCWGVLQLHSNQLPEYSVCSLWEMSQIIHSWTTTLGQCSRYSAVYSRSRDVSVQSVFCHNPSSMRIYHVCFCVRRAKSARWHGVTRLRPHVLLER